MMSRVRKAARSGVQEGRRVVLVSNLDSLKQKNLYQAYGLPEYDFVFVSYRGPLCNLRLPSNARSVTYPPKLLSRAAFYHRLLSSYRERLNHVELYTGNGAFVGLEFALASSLGIRTMVAERGALLNYERTSYARRLVLRSMYRRADEVWLRERWMVAALQRLVSREAFFNVNAVDCRQVSDRPSFHHRDIDLLWVNSFKPWRHPQRFCQLLCDSRLSNLHVEMVGLLESSSLELQREQERAQAVAPASVRFRHFSDPIPYYRRARFFVLPADIVFLNFSLIEAMAHGVVPLIADVDGAGDIVDHGVDGFLFPHTAEGLLEAMLRARAMEREQWERMSARAVEKVAQKFSLSAWAARMRETYLRLAAR